MASRRLVSGGPDSPAGGDRGRTADEVEEYRERVDQHNLSSGNAARPQTEVETAGRTMERAVPAGRVSSFGAPYRSVSSYKPHTYSSPKPAGKRVISGAMQYALLPASPPLSPSSSPPHSTNPAAGHVYVRSPPLGGPEDHHPPPSTASPRSDQLHTPLPDLNVVALPRGDTSSQYHTDISRGNAGDRREDEDEVDESLVYHLVEPDAESSFQSVSEHDVQSGDDDAEGAEEGSEEEGWIGEVLAEREADEEWMSHVRTQLNALFPDFFNEDRSEAFEPAPTLLQPQHQQIQPYPRPGARPQLDTPPVQAAYCPYPSRPDPVQAGRLAVDALPLPGFRSELGELREEIERLRGVVGGLADGLRGQVVSAPTAAMTMGKERESSDGEGVARVGCGGVDIALVGDDLDLAKRLVVEVRPIFDILPLSIRAQLSADLAERTTHRTPPPSAACAAASRSRR